MRSHLRQPYDQRRRNNGASTPEPVKSQAAPRGTGFHSGTGSASCVSRGLCAGLFGACAQKRCRARHFRAIFPWSGLKNSWRIVWKFRFVYRWRGSGENHPGGLPGHRRPERTGSGRYRRPGNRHRRHRAGKFESPRKHTARRLEQGARKHSHAPHTASKTARGFAARSK